MRYHWIRLKVESGEIIPKWISTKDQLADGLTKALASPAFTAWRQAVGLSPLDCAEEDESEKDSVDDSPTT